MNPEFSLSITSCEREDFTSAMDIAFRNANVGENGKRAISHWERNAAGLHLHEQPLSGVKLPPGAEALPFPMGLATLKDFVWAWLQTADRGREPDTDGSVEPTGFTVIASDDMQGRGVVVVVRPQWTVYGK